MSEFVRFADDSNGNYIFCHYTQIFIHKYEGQPYAILSHGERLPITDEQANEVIDKLNKFGE